MISRFFLEMGTTFWRGDVPKVGVALLGRLWRSTVHAGQNGDLGGFFKKVVPISRKKREIMFGLLVRLS